MVLLGLAALPVAPARSELTAPAMPAETVGTCRATWAAATLGRFAHGAFALAGGGAARLVDVRLPESGPAAARASAVLAGLAGEEGLVGTIGEPDRWERAPALLRIGRDRPVDLADLLVGEGLALVDAGPRDALCRPDLLAAEQVARAARRGIWAEAGTVLPARDQAALAAAAGRFAVVTGRVVSVGVRRDRTYLNFGRDWTRDFAVTIPRRTWGTLLARGHTAESLRGAEVRVRGVVEMRRAPGLDVASADMLEVTAPRRAPPARGDHDRHDDP
jgi:hypothetical protein